MSWANRDCWNVSMVDDGVVHQSPVGDECQVIGFCGKCGNSSRASRNEGVGLIKWIPSNWQNDCQWNVSRWGWVKLSTAQYLFTNMCCVVGG